MGLVLPAGWPGGHSHHGQDSTKLHKRLFSQRAQLPWAGLVGGQALLECAKSGRGGVGGPLRRKSSCRLRCHLLQEARPDPQWPVPPCPHICGFSRPFSRLLPWPLPPQQTQSWCRRDRGHSSELMLSAPGLSLLLCEMG